MEYFTPTCENCKTPIQQQTDKCPTCGFPVGGTDVQKEIFYHQLGYKKESVKDLKEKVYRARMLLWVIAALSCLYGLISYVANQEQDGALLVLIINVVIGGIFLLLASYAEEKPFTALILATAIYVAFIIYGVIEGGVSMGSVTIGKIVIIVLLIRGAVSARDAEDLMKEINKKSSK